MDSVNDERIGLRRSTRLSVLSKKSISTKEKQMPNTKRKAAAKKTQSKAKNLIIKSDSSYSESNHSEGVNYKEDEGISSGYSNDEIISTELSDEEGTSVEGDSSDSESDDFVPKKKRKVAPARKASGKAPAKKKMVDDDVLTASNRSNRGKRVMKLESSFDSKINWTSFEKKMVDQNNGLLDDAEFLLNKDVAPYLPSTSKMSAAGCYSSSLKPNKFSSGSEDEEENVDWEEMEPIGKAVGQEESVEIYLEKPQTFAEAKRSDETAKWEKFVRLEIARKRRELVENCHKVHFLCYIAHLRFLVKTVVEGQSELVDMLSEILPQEVSMLGPDLMEQTVHIFRSAFNLVSQSKAEVQTIADSAVYINHLKVESEAKSGGSAKASLKKVTKLDRNVGTDEESSLKKTPTRKSTNKVIRKKKEESHRSESSGFSSDDSVAEPRKLSRKKTLAKTSARKSLVSQPKTSQTRNYWVEYYDDIQRRWICVDPFFKIVDKPMEIEKACAQPILYVVAVDNEMGTRDITAKYASEFLSSKFRKLRVEEQWLDKTFKSAILKSDESRARIEDAQIREHLRSLPMPTLVSEYKNHPLYALEKDLLKFEAIYPEDTEQLGEIRGHKILPRSAVHHLQGELNWIRLARTVKKGEKPFKIVKARPQMKVPKEKRVPLSLKLYGYWQTTQYLPPEVDEEGRIPRNEHGNIYMYQNCMVPKKCVHLRLPGIHSIARRLDLEAAPAVIGWEFSGGGNHPVIDGCVVLEKDAAVLYNAWAEFTQRKAERDAKRAEERVWTNWKRLIKGKLLLEKMRTRFQ